MIINKINKMTKDIRKETLKAILGVFVFGSVGVFYMVFTILILHDSYPEVGSSLTTWFGYGFFSGLMVFIGVGMFNAIGGIIKELTIKIDRQNKALYMVIKSWYRGIPAKEAADVAYRRFMRNHDV
jgi:uncharacterized membrane protein YoaT (DUF817 family)